MRESFYNQKRDSAIVNDLPQKTVLDFGPSEMKIVNELRDLLQQEHEYLLEEIEDYKRILFEDSATLLQQKNEQQERRDQA